ncbi:E3 ubiquitin-protein ligase RNF146-B isoform X2 [Drosophila sulfurigaster albostrigata]|uniref:E3 ubiquitin-protein ligase RNF146-B isoform X2 n=1 Tax=Drosophila sulfurigaster albostrigata TaxID=89887 RepID=UPI002D21D60B|nr:E3 ubiquitin-protein ligase RNF146-B isoform X2 [Drosophila sulfurigaster albostrigata]
MSQQRATSSSDGGINNTEPNTPNTNNAIIVLDDSDDEEKDVQFVSVARPIMPVIDLCMSPSTSAAAAAAAAAAATTTSNTGTGDSLKTANSETTDGGALAPAPDATSDSQSAALECAICLQTCIHPARLPCGHIFCFLCVKGVAYKNRRCAMCRREIPAEFLDHPQLVNGIDDIYATRATEDGYQWYYEGRNGWWQYDDRTSQDIEEAFKKGDKSCSILVAGYVYIVDLEQLVQQRQNEPNRCRRVKRDLATIPKKGVAGLRIEGNQVTSDTVFSRPSNPTPTAAALGGPSSFISTIAARDAAIRIASDIIGSTLAHADELTRGLAASNISDSVNDLSGEQTYSNPQQTNHTSGAGAGVGAGTTEQQQSPGMVGLGASHSRSLASSHSNSIQDLMLSATEDLLDTTQQVIETNQHTIDLFEQALNDFQALTMRNFADSSDEDDDDNDNADEHNAGDNNTAVVEQTEASERPHNGHNGTLGF